MNILEFKYIWSAKLMSNVYNLNSLLMI